MKQIRYFIATTFVLLCSVFVASAQTTTPPAQPAKVTPVAMSFINVPKFEDKKEGIKRYVAAIDALDREFEPRDKELKAIQDKAVAIENELKNAGAMIDTNLLRTKQDEIAKLKREFTFKQEEGKALFQKRQNELLGPIMDDIINELEAFAKANGIKVVLDVTKISGALVIYSPEADMTKAFINDYNVKHPVTATTPAKRP